MTTALPLSVPASQIPHTHVRKQDLSQLIAGLPGVLGASPIDSLVLYTFGRGPDLHLATTLVGALPPPSAVDSLAARALAAARLTGAIAVIAVVVGGVASSPQPGSLPYRVLVTTLRRMFEAANIVLVHASWVRRATPGEPWRCYDDLDCHDMVPDEVSATLAAAATVAGVSPFSTRQDLARLLVPDGQEHLDRRSRLFDAHLKRRSAPYTGELMAMDLQLIKDTIEEATKSPELPVFSDSHLVRLAHALAHEEVRDDCLAIALSPDADAAERVWLSLVRALPAPERAEAGFLLAISTYLRGEVVVAALAMEAALDANPGHPMASVLRANLCAGTPPTHLRAMLIEAVIRATEQRATLALFDDDLDDDPDDDPPWVTDTPRRPTDPAGVTPTTEQRPTDSVAELFMSCIHAPEPAVPMPAALPELPDLAAWQPSLSTLFDQHPSWSTKDPNPSEPADSPEFPDMLSTPQIAPTAAHDNPDKETIQVQQPQAQTSATEGKVDSSAGRPEFPDMTPISPTMHIAADDGPHKKTHPKQAPTVELPQPQVSALEVPAESSASPPAAPDTLLAPAVEQPQAQASASNDPVDSASPPEVPDVMPISPIVSTAADDGLDRKAHSREASTVELPQPQVSAPEAPAESSASLPAVPDILLASVVEQTQASASEDRGDSPTVSTAAENGPNKETPPRETPAIESPQAQASASHEPSTNSPASTAAHVSPDNASPQQNATDQPQNQGTAEGMSTNDAGPPPAPEVPDATGLLPLLAPGAPRVFDLLDAISDPRGPG